MKVFKPVGRRSMKRSKKPAAKRKKVKKIILTEA